MLRRTFLQLIGLSPTLLTENETAPEKEDFVLQIQKQFKYKKGDRVIAVKPGTSYPETNEVVPERRTEGIITEIHLYYVDCVDKEDPDNGLRIQYVVCPEGNCGCYFDDCEIIGVRPMGTWFYDHEIINKME